MATIKENNVIVTNVLDGEKKSRKNRGKTLKEVSAETLPPDKSGTTVSPAENLIQLLDQLRIIMSKDKVLAADKKTSLEMLDTAKSEVYRMLSSEQQSLRSDIAELRATVGQAMESAAKVPRTYAHAASQAPDDDSKTGPG